MDSTSTQETAPLARTSSKRWGARGLSWTVGLFLVTVGVAGTFGSGESEAQKPPAAAPVPQVGVLTLRSKPTNIVTELPGRTTAYLVAEVRPQVSGILLARKFQEGAKVKQGDVLYQIDPTTYQAAYASAAAAYQKALAALPSLQAKAQAYLRLTKGAVVSRQDYVDAVAAYQEGLADVASSKANMDAARINLDHTKVTAPISGQIGRSSITPGALVTASQANPLATIHQLDPIYVDLTEPVSDLLAMRDQLRTGGLRRVAGPARVSLILDDGRRYDRTGAFEFTDAIVDQNTGTVNVRVRFPNPDHILLPGMYVRAQVESGVDPNAILAPERAVSRNPKGEATAMFVNPDGKIEQRTLTVGRTVGSNWLVTAGARAGDRLVVDGLQKIRPGEKVAPLEVSVDPKTGVARLASSR